RHRHHQLADVVVRPADGLEDETRCRAVKPEPAILVRQLNPEQSKIAHPPQRGAVERPFLLALLVIRSQPPLTEAAGHLDQRHLLRADREAQRSRHGPPRGDCWHARRDSRRDTPTRRSRGPTTPDPAPATQFASVIHGRTIGGGFAERRVAPRGVETSEPAIRRHARPEKACDLSRPDYPSLY